MANPDCRSLALLDTHIEAVTAFRGYLNDAMRFSLVVRAAQSEYAFFEGGILRFGYIGHEYDLMRYRGCEWHNVFVDKLNPKYRESAVACLFKPVYNGRQNGV